MKARGLGILLAVGTLIATGAYVFVYLYRWEWNRAIISAALFIAAEVALVGMLLLGRLRQLQQQFAGGHSAERERTARIVHAATPAPQVSFAWLARPDRLNVFIPVLLAGGVVLTGMAWVVERIARMAAGPASERRIIRGLDELQLPPNGFLAPDAGRLQLLQGPLVRSGR